MRILRPLDGGLSIAVGMFRALDCSLGAQFVRKTACDDCCARIYARHLALEFRRPSGELSFA